MSKLEQSSGNPTVDTLFSIASALGVPVDPPGGRTRADRRRAKGE
ncbi:hypothetical protein [Parafrankia sp. EUN1f]